MSLTTLTVKNATGTEKSLRMIADGSSRLYGIHSAYATAEAVGATPYTNLDLDETGVNMKTSAAQLYSLSFYNANAALRYAKVYDKASAPTNGTDATIVWTIPLKAQDWTHVQVPSTGVTFALGIGLRATTGLAGSDTGAPSANDVIVVGSYA